MQAYSNLRQWGRHTTRKKNKRTKLSIQHVEGKIRINDMAILGRPSTLLSIVKEAKQPDDSLRIAAFAVMQSIACHTWGIQVR